MSTAENQLLMFTFLFFGGIFAFLAISNYKEISSGAYKRKEMMNKKYRKGEHWEAD